MIFFLQHSIADETAVLFWWIFQNTPNIYILDEFEGSYGRFSTKWHFLAAKAAQ